jgi:hypothetical protein
MFHATMAAMKSDEDRGPIGAWARNARLAAGYHTAREATAAANAAGIPLKLQHLQGIESGWDRAGRDLLVALGRLYASAPPVSERVSSVALELEAIRAAVAEGVAEGLARWEARRAASAAPQPRRPRPRQ